MKTHQSVALLVQARTGSTRLPGKVLKEVAGRPILSWMLERLKNLHSIQTLAVITTEKPEDDGIERLCYKEGVACFRGSENDLLDRHFQAGLHFKAEAVIKVPSDCPLMDPAIVEKAVAIYRHNEFDYVSNLHPASWPDGMDVEVVDMNALETAWKEASKPFQREHCTPFIWDQPERFALCNMWYETGEDLSKTVRLTLDYPEDFQLIEAVMEKWLISSPGDYSLKAILKILKDFPDLTQLNAKYAGSYWTDTFKKDLKTLQS
ncbi:MAG: glycosyltransferase family protein [Flavobacteriales bacterium]|nr:glycosyltransferase family protein [Flavobacteriales bacterium]MCX7649653.1 glycosyltransferase family protein [Flavobacteriales bacterium]MDW8432166.1 glycosyltransferase family protein [Flavobacteriales bacterium]